MSAAVCPRIMRQGEESLRITNRFFEFLGVLARAPEAIVICHPAAKGWAG
jgi:hypothetical protein